jgi:hypothetical protein
VDAGGCVGAARALARADVTRDEHAARIVACDDALAIGTDLTAAASPRLDVAWGVTRRRL